MFSLKLREHNNRQFNTQQTGGDLNFIKFPQCQLFCVAGYKSLLKFGSRTWNSNDFRD